MNVELKILIRLAAQRLYWEKALACLCALFIASLCHAKPATVLSANPLLVSQDPASPWRLGEKIRIERGGKLIARGKIVEVPSHSNYARALLTYREVMVAHRIERRHFVELKFADIPLHQGDLVRSVAPNPKSPVLGETQAIRPRPKRVKKARKIVAMRSSKPNRSLTQKHQVVPVAAASPSPAPPKATAKKADRAITAIAPAAMEETHEPVKSDLTLGFDYINPAVTFQFSLCRKLSLGISSQLVDYSPNSLGGTLHGYGGLFSVNYYSDENFSGAWVQAAAGVYSITASNATTSLSTAPPDFQATFGWRWLWPNGLNLGVAAGVNYLSPARIRPVINGFSGVTPALLMDIGFTL